MSHATKDSARGRWKGILTHFGINPAILVNKEQKCPFCGGKDRWSWDDKDGNGTYFCRGCGPGDGFRFLMNARGWDVARAFREVDGIIGDVKADTVRAERSESDKREDLKRVWKQAIPVTPGTPSWDYLESRCGDPAGVLRHLRHHPGLPHSASGGVHPAMLAAICYPDGKVASIHRTFLTAGGRKASVDPVRMIMQGSPIKGASLPLGPAQERMGIAEGIETAICAGKMFGLPVWSALSANGILTWEPPTCVKSVVIFGDCDENYVGQAAAYDKAKAMRLKGFDVEVCIPAVKGRDWQDVWLETNIEGAA